MTDFKNKRHKQVLPLFVKYLQIRQLIQLLRFASFQTYTLPNACAASTLMLLNDIPAAFPFPHILSLTTFLNHKKPLRALSLFANNPLTLFEQPKSSPNQPLFDGIHRQTQLLHWVLCSRFEAGPSVALAGCSSGCRNGELGSNIRYGVRMFTPFTYCYSAL